jgi:N-succinyldiaminopimelate aminotransferase
MNPALAQLRPYPFERLHALLADAQPPAQLPHISMSIGEPRHPPPQFVLDALTSAATRRLPACRSSDPLRRRG